MVGRLNPICVYSALILTENLKMQSETVSWYIVGDIAVTTPGVGK
jgi:hypothetical protein